MEGDYKKIIDIKNDLDRSYLKLNSQFDFVKELINNWVESNWVDIEKEYFNKVGVLDIHNLNESMVEIKRYLSYYLSQISSANKNRGVTNHFNQIMHSNESEFTSLMILNFNYTNTVEKYVDKRQVNYIHGRLNDKKNPIIFGYGDETDKKYKQLEDLEKNEYLRHMKSFAYLQTSNYKNLFQFLDTDKFEVYIMGHSCGVSDRLLFKHIFEHHNFTSVQLYFHQKSETENDFFEKTQNLSRYFDLDSKHKMRTKVVPFNESKPLVPFKPKQTI